MKKLNTQSKYAGLKGLALVLLVGVLVFGGVGITGAAAQSALPGDTLYSVKSTIERTRLSFAQDAGQRAELRLGFAEQRLQEIEALIAEGRFQEVGEAALAFEADLHGALLELETIARLDPARGTELALQITSALQRFSQSLSQMAAMAPEGVRMEVERALETTQLASGLEAVSLTADDNSNSNINGEDESNTNGEDDSNINGEDDCLTAGITDTNSNGDDDCETADDNSNINGDDDSNTNGDDSLSADSGNSNSDDSGGSSGSGSSGSGGGGSDDGGTSGSGGSGGGGGDD